MNFRHLEAFVGIARTGSVTRAAEELFLTQPSVSQQIRELEEELGLPLFDRMARGITPTEVGAALLPLAERLLADREAFAEEAARHLGLLTGTLTLYASNIPGEYILPALIGKFKGLHPELRIIHKVADSSEVIDLIADQRAQIGVVGRSDPNPDLVFDPLWEDNISLYGAPGISAKNPISLDELTALPLIAREAGSASRKTVEEALAKAGVDTGKITILAEMNSTSAVREALAAGVGVSFMSDVSAKREVSNSTLARIEISGFEPVTRRFHLVTNKKRALSPAARAMRLFLLESAGV